MRPAGEIYKRFASRALHEQDKWATLSPALILSEGSATHQESPGFVWLYDTISAMISLPILTLFIFIAKTQGNKAQALFI